MRICFLIMIICCTGILPGGMVASLYAQSGREKAPKKAVDTSIKAVKVKRSDSLPPKPGIDSFILKRKGLLGKLARNLLRDTLRENIAALTPIRNDLVFSIYDKRVIRSVTLKGLDFGTAITDTNKVYKSRLTRLANGFHHKTRGYVIRNNLFFHPGDRVDPYLLADNERHLRDQTYLQDARIIIEPAENSYDSVDVIVLTKDVLSIGGSLHLRNMKSFDVSAREDNLGGWGDRLLGSVLYDTRRVDRVGYGMEFIKRNIAGSFIDGYVGYKNFADGLNSGRDEETTFYTKFIRPLVNQYTKFTYAAELAWHETENQYIPDSIYQKGFAYKYYNYDAWMGWNTGAFKLVKEKNQDGRLRTILGLRLMKKRFEMIPDSFKVHYDAQFADMYGVLGSLSIFGQNFYKTRYIYGFGRSEDLPEGMDVTATAGWTKKNGVERPYMGLDVSRNYFTERESYLNFTFRAGGFWNKNTLQDVDILANIDFFSRLRSMGPRWKQRTFINVGITGQINKELNEDLWLESNFGIRELYNGRNIGGDMRATLKGESVFFSPWTFVNFRFAPFAFANFTLMTPPYESIKQSDLYQSIGAGLRARNESLIFGTLELKAHYFPRANYYGAHWRVDFNTNIKFKYNTQIIKRPEIIVAN
ncbi:hypothetical protein EV199_5860 [Pseudobacter ginsenosidimutans]|uniref:Hemolysin activation/secretion protein n=2 Tax=Pseudobacter ginsenosidimutans TaxID=661488 RepID=A0A4Q7MAZ5_9BACT|nr:hypothetical protein EV199_5860 [Pseudobacter ginsenosidimutans]